MQQQKHIKIYVAGNGALLPLLLCIFFINAAIKDKDDGGGCQTSLTLLKQTLADSAGFFVKVHAAENLIRLGCTAGIREQFEQLQKESTGNEIGATRVLARLHRHDPAAYKACINLLVNRFRNGPVQTRLVALESLGKLGYHDSSAAVKAYADTGTAGFKAMARWVLANSGTQDAENRLSELLLSHEPADYRYAAYALRFQTAVNPRTLQRLRSCLNGLPGTDADRVYVASCLYVHGRGAVKKQAKGILLTYLNGTVAQQYEMAEALGIAGSRSDVPLLQTLLLDSNADIRVAAANALSKLMRCTCQE